MKSEFRKTLDFLRSKGELLDIESEVDPYLEASHLHLLINQAKGPALFFHKLKNCRFPAASNIFGTYDRIELLFGSNTGIIQFLIDLKNHPDKVFKQPVQSLKVIPGLINALPKKKKRNNLIEITKNDLPAIVCWPDDGGAFITMPQVYSENPVNPGWRNSNLGMYRIQIDGNQYNTDEMGLHYQLHRGIGVHHTLAKNHNLPFKISIFVGGHPAMPFSAVMPLPEGIPEVSFAGVLMGKRFAYYRENGFVISQQSDFVITGEVIKDLNKPEGPFGDHLGYYSLTHPFPVLKIHKIYAVPDAVWHFTVVGRPPQEDSMFGKYIHDLTGRALPAEIPGLQSVNAVDESGVHPLLFAVGSERYTPYLETQRPQELITIALHILGTGQLSLAKYLFIAAPFEQREKIDPYNTKDFLTYILERIDFYRDLHYITQTTIDTLDYSGDELNAGSKVIVAAYGPKKRDLAVEWQGDKQIPNATGIKMAMPGVCMIEFPAFKSYEIAQNEIKELSCWLEHNTGEDIPMFVLVDDVDFASANMSNFLWVTFTKSDPAKDTYGVGKVTVNKHWGCRQWIIDARVKPHHAPELKMDQNVLKRIDQKFNHSGSPLHRYLKSVL